MEDLGTSRSNQLDSDREFRKTCRRYNDRGNAHALTFSCYQRRPFLARDRSRLWFLEALGTASRKHHFAVWAYVLMPEHVHLVLFPCEDHYSISTILGDIKQPVTRAVLKYVRQHAPPFLANMADVGANGQTTHHFWQRGGGYDRNLVTPDAVHRTIDYIHANPVRRGLVESPTDWEWSSARYYEGRSGVHLDPDDDDLPPRVAGV